MGVHNQEERKVFFVEKPPYPSNMMIEVTNACNHKCIFCGNNHQKRKRTMADRQLTLSIIEQAIELGVKEMGFYLSGEPLLCNDLESFISFAKSKTNQMGKGIEYAYLTTNGVLATSERVRRLSEVGLDSIKFSINGLSRETYTQIHGKDDIETVKKNIVDIYNMKKSGKIKINTYISFIVCKLNQREVEPFKDYFSKYVDGIVFDNMHSQHGDNQVMHDIVLEDQAQYSVTDWPCSMMFNRFHITSDGYLDACCTDYDNSTAVADLRTMSLADAWNCEDFVLLRREHLNKTKSHKRCYYCVNCMDVETLEPVNAQLFMN